MAWIAAVDEPEGTAQLRLEPEALGVQAPEPRQRWPLEAASKVRVQYREVLITGLGPRQEYPVTLQLNGITVASAKFTTLPNEMPTLGAKPFTVLLGSCFAYHEDSDHKLGNTFLHMPHSASPELKIFAGDQDARAEILPWHDLLDRLQWIALGADRLDDTDDAVHGQQQLASFNTHVGGYCFQPIKIFGGGPIAAARSSCSRASVQGQPRNVIIQHGFSAADMIALRHMPRVSSRTTVHMT
jgi:hypothetical protein